MRNFKHKKLGFGILGQYTLVVILLSIIGFLSLSCHSPYKRVFASNISKGLKLQGVPLAVANSTEISPNTTMFFDSKGLPVEVFHIIESALNASERKLKIICCCELWPCGGTNDRLRGLVAVAALAHMHGRQLVVDGTLAYAFEKCTKCGLKMARSVHRIQSPCPILPKFDDNRTVEFVQANCITLVTNRTDIKTFFKHCFYSRRAGFSHSGCGSYILHRLLDAADRERVRYQPRRTFFQCFYY
jgi:hypothetical protein